MKKEIPPKAGFVTLLQRTIFSFLDLPPKFLEKLKNSLFIMNEKQNAANTKIKYLLGSIFPIKKEF